MPARVTAQAAPGRAGGRYNVPVARSCPNGCRLLHGPYRVPPLRVGDRETCLVRDCLCRVTGYSAGPIPWPMGVPAGGRSGPGFIVTEELARAVRVAAANAVRWRGSSTRS